MKQTILFTIAFVLIGYLFSNNPISYESYSFPQEVKDSWKNTNTLRNMPIPDTTYIANDSTRVTKNGVQYEFPFFSNSDFCNSASLNGFLELVSNDSDEIPVEIYFEEGVYLFTESISFKDEANSLKNIIIRGAGGRKTVFHFDLNDDGETPDYERNCIEFWYSNNVGIEDICIVRTDDWAEIPTGTEVPMSIIESNFIRDYGLGIVYDPVSRAILDGYYPEHSQNSSIIGGCTLKIVHSSNCWMTGVESCFAHRNHFVFSSSDSIYVNGCHIYDCLQWGDGGHGYGISILDNVRNSLFENNIIEGCRHGFGLENAPNRNVIAYNYIFKPRPTTDKAICLHGEDDKNHTVNGPEYNLFEGNTITDNSADYGGGIYCYSSNPGLENVTITGNSADFHGGGICCWGNSNPGLENVTIMYNSADYGGGIYCRENSSPGLENVTITGNSADFYGGGIYCWESSSPVLVNVTITGNSAALGGGIYCWENSSPSLVNCIFWNNSPQEVAFASYIDPNTITISYSDIEGGEEGIETNNNGTVNWLEGNINAEPLFVNGEMGDYHLTEDSPCVDAGVAFFEYEGEVLVDLSEDEYFGIAPDMGAYEYGIVNTSKLKIENVKLKINTFPNPFNPETNILFELSACSNVLLEIYNIKGQKVTTLINDTFEAGSHKVTWNAADQSSGIYLLRFITAEKREMKKLILLK
jgi:predicted outer membrane repeat protein